MEKLFPGSYRPTAQGLELALKEATIAFDASVLLHIYRYSPETRDQLFDAMKKIGERLWIPYQAVEEFHRNREDVIEQQHSAFAPLREAFEASSKTLSTLKRHPSIDLQRLQKIAADALTQAEEELKKAEARRITVSDDNLLDQLTRIVGTHVGTRPSEEELEERRTIAADRFTRKVPPGYKDQDKSESKQFGDYLIWRELIDHAKETKRDVIFVTDDQKEDWWLIQRGQQIGPRRELIEEMRHQADVLFHAYTPERFLTYAQASLGIDKNEEVIAEAKDVSGRTVRRPDPTLPRPIPGIPTGAAGPFDGLSGLSANSKSWTEALQRITGLSDIGLVSAAARDAFVAPLDLATERMLTGQGLPTNVGDVARMTDISRAIGLAVSQAFMPNALGDVSLAASQALMPNALRDIALAAGVGAWSGAQRASRQSQVEQSSDDEDDDAVET